MLYSSAIRAVLEIAIFISLLMGGKMSTGKPRPAHLIWWERTPCSCSSRFLHCSSSSLREKKTCSVSTTGTWL